MIFPFLRESAALLPRYRREYRSLENLTIERAEDFLKLYKADSRAFGYASEKTCWAGLNICRNVAHSFRDIVPLDLFETLAITLTQQLVATEGIDPEELLQLGKIANVIKEAWAKAQWPETKEGKQQTPIPTQTRIGGQIGYYRLQDWWLTTFTSEEQNHIVQKYSPFGTSSSIGLVAGEVSFTSQSAVEFLRSLASWFNNKADKHLGKRILDKAAEEGGEFWFAKVGRLKADERADQVVRECVENIPFPAAFREIGIAIRKDIRVLRKVKADTREKLMTLYKWAVVQDFFDGIEWNRVHDNLLLHSTAKACIADIETPYDKIGYSHLALLKKTDVKWLVEELGEPKGHSTAREANPALWQKAVEVFRDAAKRDEQQFWRSHGFSTLPHR